MAKPRLEIEIGKKYGEATPVRELLGRDKHGHILYDVECSCGAIFQATPARVYSGKCLCKECIEQRQRDKAEEKLMSYVGETINNWEILSYEGRRETTGINVFRCKCIYCGSEEVKGLSEIKSVNGDGCKRCAQGFSYFEIKDGIGVGHLPSGEEFFIDEADVHKVENYHWIIDGDGYAVSKDLGERFGKNAIPLHRYLLGLAGTVLPRVDHWSRNRLDCRRKNLHVVTAWQNAVNASVPDTNTTGYRGVSRKGDMYRARIGFDGREYTLGHSTDAAVCAQMYNYAAILLRSRFAGHLNDVPECPDKVKRKIDQQLAHCMGRAKELQMEGESQTAVLF